MTEGALDRLVNGGVEQRTVLPSTVRPGSQRILLTLTDLAGGLLAVLGTYGIWVRVLGHEFLLWQVAFLTALSLTWVVGLAMSSALNNRLLSSLLDDVPPIVRRVLAISFVFALGVTAATLNPDYAGLVLIAATLGSVALVASRGLACLWLPLIGATRRRVLIVGAGTVGVRVAQLLAKGRRSGVDVVGFLDKNPLEESRTAEEDAPRVLGSSYDLSDAVRRHDVNEVVIAFSTAPHHRVLELIWECDRLGVDVSIVPRLFEAATVQSSVENVGGVPLMHLNRTRIVGYSASIKRVFDVIATTAGLLVIWPLMLAVAVAVKLESPGPVFFSQRRVGCDGQHFTVYKFRSMNVTAEQEGTWTKTKDPRRTRVGRIIRPLNIDELPQLFNVLKGDMSLVGPRPEQPSYAELFEGSVYRYGDRHRVKSGISGWAQVNGLRGDTSIEERVLFDNFYIENWSFWLDAKIILLTLMKSGISLPELKPRT